MKKLILTILSILAISILLVFNSCKEYWPWPGDGTGDDDEVRSYTGTQSPGDVWTFDLNFTLMTWIGTWDHGTELVLTDDVTLGGTFTELPSGYLKMVITSAMPPDPLYPSDGTGFFYALEIPGMSLFANPKGNLTGSIINAVDRSTCPSVSDFQSNYNYIYLAPGSPTYSPRTEGAYGDFFLDGSTLADQIRVLFYKERSLDCLYDPWTCTVWRDLPDPPGWGECIDGTVDFYDGGVYVRRAQFTTSGVFMMDFGAGAGGIYGSKYGSGITVHDITGKQFRGFVSNPVTGLHRATTIEFDPVTFIGEGSLYLDVETNVIDVAEINPVTITRVSGEGLLEAQIENSSGLIAPMVGVISINGSDIVITALTHTDEAPFGAITAVMVFTP